MTTIKNNAIEWEPVENTGAEAYPTIDGVDYEITISSRERPHTAYYSASTPNNRSWMVAVYGGEEIAYGDSDGLRNAKRDALAALNAHLARTTG